MAGGLTDEQMAAPEEGGPESFLHPDKFKPSPQHRKLKNTGSIDQVRRDLDPNQIRNPSLPRAAAEAVSGAGNSLVDAATAGGYTGLLEAAANASRHPIVSRIPGMGAVGDVADDVLGDVHRYRRDMPVAASITDVPAYLEGATVPGKVASGVFEALPEVETLGGRAAKAVVGGGATSALLSGANAAFHGASPQEFIEDVGRGGAVGTVGAAALAVPASMASAAAQAILNSKGGRTRQFLESKGVEVGPTTPGRGGRMDTMATRGTSDADIGIQESVSARKGLKMLRDESRANRAPIGADKARIEESGQGAGLHEVDDIVVKMRDAASRIGADDRAASALQSELRRIEEAQGQGFNPDTDGYFLSETQINDLKAKLDRLGGTGESADVRLKPLRDAAAQLRKITDVGPYADVNKRFADEYARSGRAREQLGLSAKSKKAKDAKGEISTVKNLIGRAGQNTITAGGQRPELEAFRAENPAIAQEFDRPEILRKRADISFHVLPQKHGGLIERGTSAVGSGLMGGALAESLLHAISTGHLSPGQMAAAASLGFTMRNLPALSARLAYGPALAAQAAEPLILGEVPMLAAARNAYPMEERH